MYILTNQVPLTFFKQSSRCKQHIKHLSTSSSRQPPPHHPSWYATVDEWTNAVYQQSMQRQSSRVSQIEADILHRFYATFQLPQLPYYSTVNEYRDNGIEIHPASHLAYFVSHTPTK
jgi:hypothetical protein